MLKWDDIELITPAELERLPPGTKLRCINGTTVIIGVDFIDTDTRGGYLAFGFCADIPRPSTTQDSDKPE